MEEIIASISRIIAEDNRSADARAAARCGAAKAATFSN